MKEWLTAQELADQRLPELPETRRGIQLLAESQWWNDHPRHARQRDGRGGGLEYHIALLPTLARLEYERRHARIEAPAPSLAAAPVLGTDLTDRAARERDARLAIVAAFEAFRAGQRLGDASLIQVFVERYNMGAIAIDDWIRGTVRSLSKRTLARWMSAKVQGRVDKLAVDRGAARKGKGVLDTAEGGRIRSFVLALIAHQPLLSADQVRRQCRAEFGDTIKAGAKSIAMPPIRTFQHFLAGLKASEAVLLARLSDPDRYRSTMAPSGVGSYRHVRDPNTLWMIDASPVDALCVDGRHSVYACIDIATRRTILYCSRTPRAAAVGMLIRRAILAWGVPAQVKTDNGSDFVSEATRRLFAALGIEALTSTRYSPQEKGHVERVIRTFQADCATLLPGFVGHSVADRKRIEDRKGFAERLGQDTAEAFGVELTAAALQSHVDRWAETIYAQRVHAALGMSPVQAAARSTAPVRTVDARALDVLLMPVAVGGGIRVVTKFGVRIDHHHYVVTACLPGDRVLVRMDPMDAGRLLAFDAETGVYRGEGICPELAGIAPAAILQAKRETQAAILDERGREAKAEIKRLLKGPTMIEKALLVAEGDLAKAAAAAANVVALPKREERHETPAIAAALEAAARPGPVPAPLNARAAALHAQLSAEPEPPPAPENVRPLRKGETSHQRFRRARDLEARRAAGQALSEDEAFWLGGYSAGPEYRAMRAVYEDAGGQELR